MARGEEKKTGGLIKSIVTAPIKMAKMPFKMYRDYYGKPKSLLGRDIIRREEYTGTFLQKKRLVKVIKLLYSGENLSQEDRLFMDMYNDFHTEEGYSKIDQENVTMKCSDIEDCEPYLYKEIKRSKSVLDKDDDSDNLKNNQQKNNLIRSINITFKNNLEPKNTSKKFSKNGTYGFRVIKHEITSKGIVFFITNNSLEKDDVLLIFKTPAKDLDYINDKPITYDVYQNSFKIPLKQDIELGKFTVKIII